MGKFNPKFFLKILECAISIFEDTDIIDGEMDCVLPDEPNSERRKWKLKHDSKPELDLCKSVTKVYKCKKISNAPELEIEPSLLETFTQRIFSLFPGWSWVNPPLNVRICSVSI